MLLVLVTPMIQTANPKDVRKRTFIRTGRVDTQTLEDRQALFLYQPFENVIKTMTYDIGIIIPYLFIAVEWNKWLLHERLAHLSHR